VSGDAPVSVQHRPDAGCFELLLDGHRCELDYRLQSGVMAITHTGVPRALEGRGLAARLVQAALAHARAEGLRVRPVCSYVATYMRRHPETQDLLEPHAP
jgi:predicted GNAT family acetyltransferase